MSVLSMFSKQNVPPPAPVQPEAADSLASLRQEAARIDARLRAAMDRHFAATQAVRGAPPAYLTATVESLELERRRLQAQIEAAEQEQAQEDTQTRTAESRKALPAYLALTRDVVDALKTLREAVQAANTFRSRLDREGKLDPYTLGAIDLGEFQDADRLDGVIREVEAIAGQNGNVR